MGGPSARGKSWGSRAPLGTHGGAEGAVLRVQIGAKLTPKRLSKGFKFAHTGCLGAPGPFARSPSAAALPHTSDPSPCSPRGPSQRPGGSLQSAGPLHTKAPLFSSWGRVVLLCSPRPFLNGWTCFFFKFHLQHPGSTHTRTHPKLHHHPKTKPCLFPIQEMA